MLRLSIKRVARRARIAFTLVEVMVSVAIIGIVFVALYSGIASGFAVISLAREELRAAQILQDRLEEFRLYSWPQLSSFGTSNSFVPSSFTSPFVPTNTTSSISGGSVGGLTFYGTIDIAASGLTESYKDHLKFVTISITWTNGSVPRNRSVNTFVSEYGMQNYIF